MMIILIFIIKEYNAIHTFLCSSMYDHAIYEIVQRDRGYCTKLTFAYSQLHFLRIYNNPKNNSYPLSAIVSDWKRIGLMPTKKKSKLHSFSSASRSVITSFNSSSQSDEIINNIFEVVTKDSRTNHQSSTREMRDIGTMTNSFDRGDNSSLLFDNSSDSNANSEY